MRIVDYETFTKLRKEQELKGINNIKAFYNHTLDIFCKDNHALMLPLDDHIVHRGDGVFESIACRKRKVIQLDKHLARLQNSLEALSMKLPLTLSELREKILQTATLADFDEGSIRLLIGRGVGGFGVDPKECPQASLYIIAAESKAKKNDDYLQGFTAHRSEIPVKQRYLAKIKSTNYLPNVLMSQEAHDRNVDIVFSYDVNNHLAESAISNVGMYKDGIFYFPTFEHILSGTTVITAMEKAKELGEVCLKDITEEFLQSADEVFSIGSVWACVGVTQYNYKDIGNGKVGPMALKLRELLLQNIVDEGIAY